MAKIIVILFILGFHSFSFSEVYECQRNAEENDINVHYVKWNTENKNAVVKNGLGTHRGKVTSVRKHNDGMKVNLFVENENPIFTGKNSEYVIFSWENRYRIAGINYIYENEERLLDTLAGNVIIDCEKKI